MKVSYCSRRYLHFVSKPLSKSATQFKLFANFRH